MYYTQQSIDCSVTIIITINRKRVSEINGTYQRVWEAALSTKGFSLKQPIVVILPHPPPPPLPI